VGKSISFSDASFHHLSHGLSCLCFTRFRDKYKPQLGNYKSSGVSWQRAAKANEHTAVDFETNIVNATFQEMHLQYPVEDSRHFPWLTLADVPVDSEYNVDELPATENPKQPKSLHSTCAEVTLIQFARVNVHRLTASFVLLYLSKRGGKVLRRR